MTVALALALPLALILLLRLTAGRLVAAIRPQTAVRLLVFSSLVAAGAMGFVLAVLAFDVVALNTRVAALGHWSVPLLQKSTPVPGWVGLVSGIIVVPLLATAIARALTFLRQIWTADVVCRQIGRGVDGLVIVDDDEPDAFAVQGLRGRTVVSTGMLAALDAQERRVLLAHEHSHLRNRHALHVLLAELSAAGNPLLRPVAEAVRLGVERWADEDAAQAIGCRRTAARAVARASLAARERTGRCRPETVLAMAQSAMAARAAALLAPSPRKRHGLAAVLLAIALVCLSTTLTLAAVTNNQFERARLPVASLSR